MNDEDPAELEVVQPGPKESTTGEGSLSSLGGYYNEIEYFVNCLNAGKAPENATLAQATDSIRVLLAELESAKSGSIAKL